MLNTLPIINGAGPSALQKRAHNWTHTDQAEAAMSSAAAAPKPAAAAEEPIAAAVDDEEESRGAEIEARAALPSDEAVAPAGDNDNDDAPGDAPVGVSEELPPPQRIA